MSAVRLRRSELEALWTDVRSADAGKAYDALWKMVASPEEALAFLRTHLQPRGPANEREVAQWISDLGSDNFVIREKAANALEDLAELAEPAIRDALRGNPGPEMGRRLERLLARLNPVQNPGQLGDLRAVEVLEHIGNPEARAVLTSLTRGASTSRLTHEATEALARLAKHDGTIPE